MSERLDNLLILARRAVENDDHSSAVKYYEQILMEEPSNWEAVFYTDYCRAASCVIRDIGPAAQRVKKGFSTAFSMIQNSDIKDKKSILYRLCDKTNALLVVLSNAAYNHYMQHRSVNGAKAEYCARVYECGIAACLLGDLFYDIGDKRVSTLCYKKALMLWRGQYTLNDVAINRIKEYEPGYEPPKNGCYVATCVYGSYDCPQVWTLRRYRDTALAKTWYGRAFIKAYYAISPTLVKWFGKTSWFKKMWKGKLDRMVKRLQEEGFESTPYEDKKW